MRAHLAEYGLRFAQFASGLTAKTMGLSLSASDESRRRRSVRAVKDISEWIGTSEPGIILGFFKGAAVEDTERAKEAIRRSLAELAEDRRPDSAPLILEATNHYESSIANTLEEAAGLIGPYAGQGFGILPDTYHMNIEETDMFSALLKYAGRYSTLHISDNTRYFPGFGAMDFEKILGFMLLHGYRGTVSMEGFLKKSPVSDLEFSMRYLHEFGRSAS